MKKKLQVFISSTYTDLIQERQAAVSAILKAGHIPAGMELFTAGDRSQMTTIQEWIDESDVYMLILGGRYGSIEPTSGISYTELEYDYATQQGKPLFAVVIKDEALEAKVKAGGTVFIEKENPKELTLFRNKVLSNISSFFEDCKDIRLCVHESMADLAANPNLKGWVSGDEIVDTKPLFDEIKKLSDENRSLKETLEVAKKNLTKTEVKGEGKQETYGELMEVLTAIKVKVPANLAGGKEVEHDLLGIFVSTKDTLISGVTNAVGTSDYQTFLYYNICPKLQVHDLVINEKVPGVRYRRSCVSSEGMKFLAYIERETLKLESKKAASLPKGAEDSSKANQQKSKKKPKTKKAGED